MAVDCRRTLFISGWCFDEHQLVSQLQIVLDGVGSPVMASQMPRYDVSQRFRRSPGVRRRAHRSGFWGLVEVGEGAGPVVEVGLRGRVEGRCLERALGTISLDRSVMSTSGTQEAEPAVNETDPLIAICMTTYNPPPREFQRQVESIRSQTYKNWICIVSDDRSEPAAYQMVQDVLAGDARFLLHRNSQRLGFYRNFESCLRLAPKRAAYVALCDQDDRWHPEKLATLLTCIRAENAVLAYSDMRIVDEERRTVRDTFWRLGRQNNCTDLETMLYANSVTGASALYSRKVVDAALPFPNVRGAYHDHWLACVALSMGRLVYLNRPLYDYMQHSGNVLGDLARPGPENLADRNPRQWYFVNVIPSMVFSREMLSRREKALTGEHHRTLERVSQLESWEGYLGLLICTVRRPGEIRLLKIVFGLVWRWLAALPSLPPNRVASMITTVASNMIE